MEELQLCYLQAFIVALAQQTSPLPEDIQNQLKQLTVNFEISKLIKLIEGYSPLYNKYKTVRNYLVNRAGERGKGILPDEESELKAVNPTDRSNVAGTIPAEDQKSLPEIIAKLEEKYPTLEHLEQLKQSTIDIFSYPNLIAAAQTLLF